MKIGKIIVFVISPLLGEFIRLQNQSRVFFIIRIYMIEQLPLIKVSSDFIIHIYSFSV